MPSADDVASGRAVVRDGAIVWRPEPPASPAFPPTSPPSAGPPPEKPIETVQAVGVYRPMTVYGLGPAQPIGSPPHAGGSGFIGPPKRFTDPALEAMLAANRAAREAADSSAKTTLDAMRAGVDGAVGELRADVEALLEDARGSTSRAVARLSAEADEWLGAGREALALAGSALSAEADALLGTARQALSQAGSVLGGVGMGVLSLAQGITDLPRALSEALRGAFSSELVELYSARRSS